MRAELAVQHTNLVKLTSGHNGSVHPHVAHVPGNCLSELVSFRSHYRVKKQSKREMKMAEKEEKRRKAELDDRKKRRTLEHLKAVMSHRDNFFKFHKFKRTGEIDVFV